MSKPTLLSSALCILLLLSGCAVDQKKEVATYRKVLDANYPPVTILEPNEPLTLDRAMSLANQHNEQLDVKGEDYLQALIDKDRVAANFLPTVSLAPAYQISDAGAGGTGGGGSFKNVGSTLHRFDVPLTGSMNLFRGGGDVANLKRADLTAEQQKSLLLDLQASVLLSAAQTYYQVLRSEQLVVVLKNSSGLQQERVRDVQARNKAGLVRQLDVSQTEAQAAATRVLLVQAQSDVANGRTVLAFLIGVPAVPGPLSDKFDVPAQRPSTDEFEQQAVTRRRDLVAAQAAVAAARDAVDAAVAEYYPSVSLNINAYLYRFNYADASKWSSVLSANLPIFTGGVIQADVRTAWSKLRQAAMTESLLRRQVLQDSRVASENLTASDQRLVELQTETSAAAEALKQAEQSYKVGLATNLERLTAQDALLNAQLQQTSEEFNHKVFYLNLLRVTGAFEKNVAVPVP